MDNSPADPPANDNGLFLEPLHGWRTGRVSHSPAIMASPTALSMELSDGSQDGPYERAEETTGMSVLSGKLPAGSTGGHSQMQLLKQASRISANKTPGGKCSFNIKHLL